MKAIQCAGAAKCETEVCLVRGTEDPAVLEASGMSDPRGRGFHIVSISCWEVC